jgi:hypothetical protein
MSAKTQVEKVMVTPQMAREWLIQNRRNRSINKNRVRMYADEMRAGQWFFTHQGIAFYEDGMLADGQHRLMAIAESGCSFPMLVTYGLPTEAGLVVDEVQPRKTHQAIEISQMAEWIGRDEVACARIINLINTKATAKMSNAAIINVAETYKSSIQFGVNAMRGTKRYITTATTKACIGIASQYESPDRLREFGAVMQTGVSKGAQDVAAIRLREWLIDSSGAHRTGGQGTLSAVRRTQRAIKAFCEYQEMGKLYEPANFLYMPIPDSHLEDQEDAA